MRPIELTQSQIKALGNGATMLMFPLGKIQNKVLEDVTFNYQEDLEDELLDSFKLQKGDKDVWVKEEFAELSKQLSRDFNELVDKNRRVYDFLDIVYKSDYDEKEIFFDNWTPSSQMTKEQSRYSFKEILDVRIVRVQDMIINDCIKVLWLKGTLCNGEFELANLVAKEFKNHYNQQMQEQGLNKTYEDNDYVFLVEVER